MLCSNCGKQVESGASFCHHCGSEIRSVSDNTGQNTCIKCNHLNRPEISYCEECGSPLEPRTTSPVSTKHVVVETSQEAAGCSRCGHINRPGIFYCEECGGEISGGPIKRTETSTRSTPKTRKKSRMVPVLTGILVVITITFGGGFLLKDVIFPSLTESENVITPQEAVRVEGYGVPAINYSAPEPELSPLEIAGAESTFENPLLEDPNFDPNGESPLMITDGSTLYMHYKGNWTAFYLSEDISSIPSLQQIAMLSSTPQLPEGGGISSYFGQDQNSKTLTWLGSPPAGSLYGDLKPALGWKSFVNRTASFINPSPVIKLGKLGNEYILEPAAEELGEGLDYMEDKLVEVQGIVFDGTKWTLEKGVDAAEWTAQQGIDGVMWVWDGANYVAYETGQAGKFVLIETIDGAKWTWEQISDFYQWVTFDLLEYNCGPDGKGEPGPGPGPDGSLKDGIFELRTHPKDSFAEGYTAEEWEKLELARAWIPLIQPSKDETCGEIIRVVASVFPYRNGAVVESLHDADSVEIVYTIFYRYDGGRWYIYHHASDNEGFTIGLTRTSNPPANTRCSATDPPFQFSAGRTAKHIDLWEKKIMDLVPEDLRWLFFGYDQYGSALFEWAGLDREIEDFTYEPCPALDDPRYKIWAAENKHANYFDRVECEETLLGWHLYGVDLFGVEVDFFIGGLEECEPGRLAYDFSNSVELLREEMKNEPDPYERPLFEWGDDFVSYWHKARGNGYCPPDDLHVPVLECDSSVQDDAIKIIIDDVPNNTEWLITAIGMDGFDPKMQINTSPPIFADNLSTSVGNAAISNLPIYGSIPDDPNTAQVSFMTVGDEDLTFFVDSADGRPGRFALIIQSKTGSVIIPASDQDLISIEGVPNSHLAVYAVANSPGLDLALEYVNNNQINSISNGMGSLQGFTPLGVFFGNETDPYIYLDLGSSAGNRDFSVSSTSGQGTYHIIAVIDTAAGIAVNPGVPDILDYSEQSARDKVEGFELRLEVIYESVSDPNKVGFVLRQSPDAGTVLQNGSTVTAWVGKSAQSAVPSVVGRTPEEAQSILEADGFVYVFNQSVELYGEDAAYIGRVIYQNPTAGTLSSPGTYVMVDLGAAPSTATIPNVIGQSLFEAQSMVEAAGFVISVNEYVELSGEDLSFAGRVISQSPLSNQIHSLGTMVSVNVGSAPVYADVPDLGGLLEADARSRVENAGLVFHRVDSKPTSESMVGRVVDQEPISGQVVSGSTINVWIGESSSDGVETVPTFPDQKISSWVSVTITGGHGSIHQIGDPVEICFSWSQLTGEPPGKWQLDDAQPPESGGVKLADGSMLTAGSDCISGTITGPTGHEEIRIFALEYNHSTESRQVVDWANVRIYVADN